MDTKRWKSVLVPREVYDEIKQLAQDEGRTISGQLRLMFETYVEKGYAEKHSYEAKRADKTDRADEANKPTKAPYDAKRDPRRMNVYD